MLPILVQTKPLKVVDEYYHYRNSYDYKNSRCKCKLILGRAAKPLSRGVSVHISISSGELARQLKIEILVTDQDLNSSSITL
jgi:hypothetical protein